MSEGGGHGGNWIVTYTDMLTLLMAGFIVIVTFGSRESDKMAPRNDSVIGSQPGSGIAGGQRKGPDKESVVVRRPPMAGNAFDRGSEMPALHSDVPVEVTKSVQDSLEKASPDRLSQDFEIALPLGLMFDQDALSTAGMKRLQEASRQVRNLPYDITVQVSKAGDFPKAVLAYTYLFQTCDLTPLRLGVGLAPSKDADGKLVLVFRHPRR
jgi:flagellar motor protein MotB